MSELKQIAAAVARLEQSKLNKAFDAFNPESRPNAKQQLIFDDIGLVQYRYVIAGNQSGKSQLAAREIAWLLTGTHPTWVRPAEWRDEPLLILIAGQDLTMMHTELWSKKIRPFLKGEEWKEVRQGNTLKRAENRRTGDQIVFLSHSDSSESNRKHLQGYVAHYVWLDEMPSSHIILEELQLRVQARRGYMLATFTPKFRNDTIRKVIDSASEPLSKKYKMSKFDNPIFANSYADEMNRLAGYTEAERRTILYGDWSTGDAAVYRFDSSFMTVSGLPEYYHKGWKHVEAVDPALRSKCGYTLWAEDPSTGVWYLVDDRYIEGTETLDPVTLVEMVRKRSANYNIVRRISDTMAWYTSIASKAGITYMTPYDKNSRKDNLIKGLQQHLSSGKIKIGGWCISFIDEIQSCQWSENTDRMVNSSSFHTLDCAQYFCDMIPKFDPINVAIPWQQELRQANQGRLKQEAKAASVGGKTRIGNSRSTQTGIKRRRR